MKISLPKIKIPDVKIPVKWSRAFGRTKLTIQAKSPEILLAAGLIGCAGTVIMACKATTKLPELVADHEEMLDDIHEMEELTETYVDLGNEPYEGLVYSKKDIREEKVRAYAVIVRDYARLYGPTVALGMLSGSAIVWSHNIKQKRYLGAVAAYNAAITTFDKYRERVREELGDEADQRFRYGYKKEKVTDEIVDENGKKKKVKEDILTLDAGDPSLYAVRFDCRNDNWQEDPYFALMFLRVQEEYFQRKLNTRGHVILNEVYDALGFDQTQEGALVGWMQGKEDEPTHYISFGLPEKNSQAEKQFLKKWTDYIILDFNVDGVIVDLLSHC